MQPNLMRVLSVLFGVVPFAFGFLRLVTTGTDSRYIWLALASLIGATVVMRLGKARRRSRSVVAALFLTAVAVSTLLAVLVAHLLGATAVLAILAVAIGFGMCSAISAALWAETHHTGAVTSK